MNDSPKVICPAYIRRLPAGSSTRRQRFIVYSARIKTCRSAPLFSSVLQGVKTAVLSDGEFHITFSFLQSESFESRIDFRSVVSVQREGARTARSI
jgi:hypothetical protein